MVANEHRNILLLMGFLTFTTLVQIIVFECYFNDSETLHPRIYIDEADKAFANDVKIDDSPILKKDGGAATGKSNEIEKKSMRPLAEILESAGVEVDDELRQALPPVEDVIEMYGSEPVIIGTDRCETFQNSIIKGEGFVGPAGIFNTVSECRKRSEVLEIKL